MPRVRQRQCGAISSETSRVAAGKQLAHQRAAAASAKITTTKRGGAQRKQRGGVSSGVA